MTERPVHMHEQEAALASRDYAGHQLLTGRCGEDAARPFLGLLGRRGSRGRGGGCRGEDRNLYGATPQREGRCNVEA